MTTVQLAPEQFELLASGVALVAAIGLVQVMLVVSIFWRFK